MESFVVTGIGELLWDMLPGGARMGGAPVNFACHAQQLGARGVPISCVGRDESGDALIEAVRKLGLDLSGMGRSEHAPTGTVQVTLDAEGTPTYVIKQGVAWDEIRPTAAHAQLAAASHAVCFGSLAQRSPVSRATIQAFVRSVPETALKIFDVNLRQSYYSREIIESSLDIANVLKVSDTELPVMAKMFDLYGTPRDQLAALLDRFGLRLVAYTRGSEGSMLVTKDDVAEHPGIKPKVVDSVGAGDSFTAALCMGLLLKHPLARVVEQANRVGGYVCTQVGATPVLPDNLRALFAAA